MIEGLVTMTDRKVVFKGMEDVLDIHPFGDIHWDTDACETDRFNRDIEDMKKSKNALFIGMGDYLDFLAWSDRKKITNAGLHDSSIEKLHKSALGDLRAFYKRIEFMKGRCLGMLHGNHDWVFADGKSGTEKLCEWLGCKYLGWVTYINIGMEYHNQGTTLGIVACHGTGGGKLMGTSINKVDDMLRIFPSADLYMQGHDHQRFGVPTSSLFSVNTPNGKEKYTLHDRERWLCRTGSYMRGYQVDTGGFVSRSLMRPSSLGKITAHVRLSIRHHNEVKRIKPEIKVEA